MFGSAPTPAPPPVPDPLPTPPSYASGALRGGPAGSKNKVPGWGSTLLTSPEGVDSSTTNVARKSLLGQ
jgi:hypothetical protein